MRGYNYLDKLLNICVSSLRIRLYEAGFFLVLCNVFYFDFVHMSNQCCHLSIMSFLYGSGLHENFLVWKS